jgi:hypothetical protein
LRGWRGRLSRSRSWRSGFRSSRWWSHRGSRRLRRSRRGGWRRSRRCTRGCCWRRGLRRSLCNSSLSRSSSWSCGTRRSRSDRRTSSGRRCSRWSWSVRRVRRNRRSHCWRCWRRCRFRSFLHRLRFRSALQLAADFFRYVDGYRAGMGLLFGNTKAGQKINNGLGLDLELTSQFVYADLRSVSHASLRILLFLLIFGSMRLRGVSRRGVRFRGGFLFRLFDDFLVGFLSRRFRFGGSRFCSLRAGFR